VRLWLSAVIALPGLLVGANQLSPSNFVPANFAGMDFHDLTLFPKDAASSVIKIQVPVQLVRFAGDGRSLYASIDDQGKLQPNLVRIDFNPVPVAPSPARETSSLKTLWSPRTAARQ
jgi:hypothetical protein